MREITCPHCQAKNRRPKCGSCRTEIPEPMAIKFAWTLYDGRKPLALIGVLSLIVLGLWRPWESFYFAPTNYSECRKDVARTARSNAAMHVLLSECSSKFGDK